MFERIIRKLNYFHQLIKVKKRRHGVKVGPGPRDPPQSLKVGPVTPLRYKSGTSRPPSNFKGGTPSSLFNEFIFFQIQKKYQL